MRAVPALSSGPRRSASAVIICAEVIAGDPIFHDQVTHAVKHRRRPIEKRFHTAGGASNRSDGREAEVYFRGGWHPFGFIGVGQAPPEAALKNINFDNPAFDPSLSYQAPAPLLAVQPPPLPEVKAVARWSPNPKHELINPWRYWILEDRSKTVEKRVSADGPVANAAGRRVLSVVGDFGSGAALNYTFSLEHKLEPGRYRFACRVRGTADKAVQFEVADGGRALGQAKSIPLSSEWQEHVVDFEIKTLNKDDTNLRFVLPKDATGNFDLTDTRLRQVD